MHDYPDGMPEGDAIHRAAMRLQVLAGQRVEVETPHPRAALKGLAEQLNGRLLESVEAVGKNVLLRFEGDRLCECNRIPTYAAKATRGALGSLKIDNNSHGLVFQ